MDRTAKVGSLKILKRKHGMDIVFVTLVSPRAIGCDISFQMKIEAEDGMHLLRTLFADLGDEEVEIISVAG